LNSEKESEEITTKEEIRDTLRDEIMRFIARFCKEPKKTSDIIDAIVESKRYDRNVTERIVSDDLAVLESLNLIEYDKDKWVTKSEAIGILERYFGG